MMANNLELQFGNSNILEIETKKLINFTLNCHF